MAKDIRIASYNIGNLFRRVRGLDNRNGNGSSRSAYALTDAARGNKALVLKEVGADVVCLQEVESEKALLTFRDRYVKKAGVNYRYAAFAPGNDARGLGMGMLSRLPISGVACKDECTKGVPLSRGMVEASLRLPGGVELAVIMGHFRSRGYGDVKKGVAARERECRELARLLGKGYDLGSDHVVVAGDLGDGPMSKQLRPIMYKKGLHDPLHLAYDDTDESWTHFLRKHDQTSYLLVSEPMKEALWATGVERRGMPLLNKHTYGDDDPFPTVKGVKDGASHHGCVWADFNL